MNDVIHSVGRIEQGQLQAAGQLLPLVYDELRRLAARNWPRRSPARPSRRRPWSTRPTSGWWPDGAGAGTAAATSSRRPPRRCGASSSRGPGARAGGSGAATGAASTSMIWTSRRATPDQLLALDEALDRLAARAPRRRAGQAALLRRVNAGGGCQPLGISPRKADQLWAYARAWLRWKCSSCRG